MKWTEEQYTAINVRGKRVLVSAAAGSGKTAVLVERVLSRITRENSPDSLDDLVILTFTNAAASEM
ncbi:MAG: UvrD-helicase domain-containing protein, partial [Clostridia bacterium]|nr:UvrD-helicase domain-containing protein [Clostridia bacterium]